MIFGKNVRTCYNSCKNRGGVKNGKKDSPVEDNKATVRREKKERTVDPEREARRLQRRAERKARREAKNEEKSE